MAVNYSPPASLYRIGSGKSKMGKYQRLLFSGVSKDDSILIGNHGNTLVRAEGRFELSGIVYCPKYTLTLEIKGEGSISLRGICHRIVVRKMAGSAKLDLSHVACKELTCISVTDDSVIVTGRVRTISNAFLSGNAVLLLTEKPLIFNQRISDRARAVFNPIPA
jgi:hypothetical protein